MTDSVSPPEIDLVKVAQYAADDGLLNDLLLMARDGVGLGVGLLVNGMIVIGRLAKPEEMASEVDAERRRMIARSERPETHSEAEWEETKEQFGTTATRSVEGMREQLQTLEEEVEAVVDREPFEVTAVPRELARRALFAGAVAHITLANVNIFAAGQRGPTNLPVMRIPVRNVAGWWILRTDDQGTVSFKLWDTDTPGLS